MEENRLYDIDSTELYELIDSARVKLEKSNEKYRKILTEIQDIKKRFPKIELLLDENKITNLDEEECKILQKLIMKYLKLSDMEEREIFFLGARENYYYFKNLDLIKD